MGKLFKLWGFHNDSPHLKALAADAKIDKFISHIPSMEHIHRQGNRVTGSHPEIHLDFGGIGKGFSLDQIVVLLKANGIKAALVDASGHIRAYDGEPANAWKVAIKKPSIEQDVLGFIEILDDESILSSGIYERFYQIDGKTVHRLIDPRTGRPAKGCLTSTVIHNNATDATALCIAGKAGWRQIAKTMNIENVLLMTDDGKMILSTAMQKRFNPIAKEQLSP